MSKDPTEEELQAARKRFYELAGIPEPEREKPVDEYMRAWQIRGSEDPTRAFIRLNEERISQGLPPLDCKGNPIAPVKVVLPPLPPVVPDGDDFFSSPGGSKTAKRYG